MSSDFSNLAHTRIMVGETEVQAFHIPVDEPDHDDLHRQQQRRLRSATETAPAAARSAHPNQPQAPNHALSPAAGKYMSPPSHRYSMSAVSGQVVPHARSASPLAAHGAAHHHQATHSVISPAAPQPRYTYMRPQQVIAGRTSPQPGAMVQMTSHSPHPTHSPQPMAYSPQPTYSPHADHSPYPPSPNRQQAHSRVTRGANAPRVSRPSVAVLAPAHTTPVRAFRSISPSSSRSSCSESSVSTASPSPPPPAASVVTQRPVVVRTSSVEEARPVIQRLASVDDTVVASVQKAREAAKADLVKAERYRNLTCPRVRDSTKGTYSLHNIWDFSDRQFLQYGLGVMLWFKLVRRLSYLFLALFIINIPSLIFNVVGPDVAVVATSNSSVSVDSDVDGTYGLSYTTMSHQGIYINSTILTLSKQEVGVVTGALDTLSIVVFYIAILLIFRDHTKESTKYNSTVMTVRRFTVLVTRLPQTTPLLTRVDLADFFQKRFGEVVDVSISYNDMQLVELFKRRGEMRREKQSLEAQDRLEERDALSKKIAALDEVIMFQRRMQQKEIRGAFVTFQHQESVAKCLAAYPRSWLADCLMPKQLRFRGVAPKVVRAAEPSNTLFENLGLPSRAQCCRRAWTGVVSLIVMSLSFVAVYVSQYYQGLIPSTTSCAQSAITSIDQVTDSTTKYCYCSGLSTSELYEAHSYCSSYIAQYAIAKSLIFLTALSTVLVNFILQVLMDKLAVLERHSSLTSQQRGVTSRLFWGLFFNTAVIILIVNADLEPYLNGRFAWVYSILPGDFADFSQEWFYQVGVSIMITMFLNTVNPHLLSLSTIPWDSCRREKCAKKKKTQTELNELYQGRKFVLSERYSVLLNTVFACMMFSSGMPLLWLVAAVTFACTYWFDKTTFLRNYRIPPRYDESLDDYAGKMLPFAVVPHLLLALWFFTSPMTDSYQLSDSIPLVTTATFTSSGGIRTSTLTLQQRLLQWNTFPTLLLLMVLAALYLARWTLELIFFCRASEAERRAARLGLEEKKSKSLTVTYAEAASKIGLESYRLNRQQEYRLAYIATESRKQLPAEVDLRVLRAAQDKSRGAPPQNKRKSVLQTDAARVKPLSSPSKYEVSDAPTVVAPPRDAWSSSSELGAAGHGHAAGAHHTRPYSDTLHALSPMSASQTPVGTSRLSVSTPTNAMLNAAVAAEAEAAALPSQPIAAPSDIGDLSDAAAITMAAAVTQDSSDYTLLPISCPACANLFQIVDCGEAMSYTCPFCQAQTII